MLIRGERRSLRAQRDAFLKRAPLMADRRFRVLGRRALSICKFSKCLQKCDFFLYTNVCFCHSTNVCLIYEFDTGPFLSPCSSNQSIYYTKKGLKEAYPPQPIKSTNHMLSNCHVIL